MKQIILQKELIGMSDGVISPLSQLKQLSLSLFRLEFLILVILYKENNIKIILGDARETVKKLNEKFDVVFLDPFSPKKCTELWTEVFFSDVKKLMKKNGILATYSCARSVRDNLRKLVFVVEDGPCIGRKSPSTIAHF